jgi:hypothetical protein
MTARYSQLFAALHVSPYGTKRRSLVGPAHRCRHDGRLHGGTGVSQRNRRCQAFLDALQADFEEHGTAVIVSVRETLPHIYLKVVASTLIADACGATRPASDIRRPLRIAIGRGSATGDPDTEKRLRGGFERSPRSEKLSKESKALGRASITASLTPPSPAGQTA